MNDTLTKSSTRKPFLTKDKKYIPRGGAIKIQTYHIPTGEVKDWKSVHSFRKYSNYRTLSGTYLQKLKLNKLIKIKDYFICKKDDIINVEDLISKKVGNNKAYVFKNEDLKILQMIAKQKQDSETIKKDKFLNELKDENENSYKNSILILDGNFSIKEIYVGKVKDLAKKEGINYNNMKSLLFKHKTRKQNFYKGIEAKSYNGKNFCYLLDY